MLWIGAGFTWISYVTNWTVYPLAWTDCKLTDFLYYFFQEFSSALLVIMSVEKCFALYFPLKTKNICTVRTAKWVTFFTALIFIIFNSQFFVISKAVENIYGYKTCIYVMVPDNYWAILNKLSGTLYSFGPFAIMGACNIAMIFKFAMAKCTSSQGGSESTSQALSKSASRGITMLITVSLTFVILTGPASVLYYITDYPNRLVVLALYLLSFLNHGINGVLYSIVGTKFRNELINTLCCRRRKPSHKASTSNIRTSTTKLSETTSSPQ